MHKSSPVGMMLDFAYGRGRANAGKTGDAASQGADPTPFDTAAVALAAKAWWESRRSAAWTLEQHLASPTTGCDETLQEQALAEAVAHWLRQGG